MKIVRKIIYPITISLIILTIIGVLITKKNLNKNKYNDIEIVKEQDSLNLEILKEIEEEKIKLNVDIKGAIKKPGVYKIDSNLTVNDVINIAGGLTENADTSVTNLAKKITDEMVIIIYTKEEVKKSNIVDTVVKVVEKECVCPNIQNDGCLNTEIKENITNKENEELVNINTATVEELQTITGIGESKAKSIIEYRKVNGNFKTIEDIKNVEGIGEKLYESIKIYITT